MMTILRTHDLICGEVEEFGSRAELVRYIAQFLPHEIELSWERYHDVIDHLSVTHGTYRYNTYTHKICTLGDNNEAVGKHIATASLRAQDSLWWPDRKNIRFADEKLAVEMKLIFG